MSNKEIHEALDFALSRGLDFSISPNGLISISKWNKPMKKFDWRFVYLPVHGQLMQLLTESYNNFKQTTS